MTRNAVGTTHMWPEPPTHTHTHTCARYEDVDTLIRVVHPNFVVFLDSDVAK